MSEKTIVSDLDEGVTVAELKKALEGLPDDTILVAVVFHVYGVDLVAVEEE